MKPLLQVGGLSHSLGEKRLFRELEFTLNAGERTGLVGHNGSGKSTLLAILAGAIEPDAGVVTRGSRLQLASVEQFIPQHLTNLTLAAALAERLPEEERQNERHQVERLLASLGFAEAELSRRVRALSGGQQNRLMFARALIREPDLILFDEPTNHLDLATLQFFETCLDEMKPDFLLVSHDRAFLDAVTNKTLFLRDGRLHQFQLAYSEARRKLAELDAAAAARRAGEERQLARLQESAKRLATWGREHGNEKLSRRAKSMRKRINRLEENRTQLAAESGLKLSLELGGSRAKRMLEIAAREVTTPDGALLFKLDGLLLRPGDRLALLGHNGAGKTTLINRILACWRADDEEDFAAFSPQCSLGHYDQELQSIAPALTLTETLRRHCPQRNESECKNGLINAGFPYPRHDAQVRRLSGGERARLMFLIMRLNRPSLLLLDEPTNHLDIQGKEELETGLLEADATLLLTSHDRRFVARVANRFAMIHRRRLTEISRPENFYALPPPGRPETPATAKRAETPPESEDALLRRIIQLENLLSADLARKPKFRKPALQAAWREELERLNRRLG